MRNHTFLPLFIFLYFCSGLVAQAYPMNAAEKCLKLSTDTTQACVAKSLPQSTIEKCYGLSQTIRSTNAREKVKDHCFYDIAEFPTLQTCIKSATQFFEADNRDQALFECYRQFQASMTEKKCLYISKFMTFSEKRRHLIKRCENL